MGQDFLLRNFLFLEHVQKTIFGDFVNHGLWHWCVRTVVANVNIEAIHDVVVRIGKQLFHGGIFDRTVYAFGNESTEVGGRGECGDIV